jgi:NAD(P)-dependent dehydrogenase (short-subunit alcohol dehydrogenase family)
VSSQGSGSPGSAKPDQAAAAVGSSPGRSLAGVTALVTGAGGKLGPVWCGVLLEAGARVAAVDRPGASRSPGFVAVAATAGDRLRWYEADVLDRAALESVRTRCAAELAEPTVLVNNAGIDAPPGPATTYRIEDVPLELFRGVLEVNLVGAFQAAQVFGPGMVRAGRGSIVNIGSLYATVSPDARFYDHLPADPPFLKPPAYGASKAGLLNLTRYLATHWGPSGVRVNALSPGGVEGGQDAEFKRKFTARVPLGRMAAPDDLRGPLIFLASEMSSYVTGIELRVDGGFTAW